MQAPSAVQMLHSYRKNTEGLEGSTFTGPPPHEHTKRAAETHDPLEAGEGQQPQKPKHQQSHRGFACHAQT